MKNELIKLYRLFLLILLAIVLYFIWPYIDNLIYILALVFLLTTILLPAVDWLEGKIHSRIAAIIIVVLTVLLVLGFFLVLFVMQLSDEAVQFSKNIDPQIFNTTLNSISSGTIEKLPDFMQQFFQEQIPKINISQKIADFAKSVISQLLLLASQIGSMLFHFFMTIILTVILLFEYYNFKKTIVNILPNKYFETGLQLIYKIEKQVSRYLGGQLM
ncbi:MAG: AI-2E family transporter, partial [Candidatus Cloacimonadota bacterium]|nr:AI-2E family transporter [Candidatus Cloacimonadota bacterium]